MSAPTLERLAFFVFMRKKVGIGDEGGPYLRGWRVGPRSGATKPGNAKCRQRLQPRERASFCWLAEPRQVSVQPVCLYGPAGRSPGGTFLNRGRVPDKVCRETSRTRPRESFPSAQSKNNPNPYQPRSRFGLFVLQPHKNCTLFGCGSGAGYCKRNCAKRGPSAKFFAWSNVRPKAF